MVRAGLSEVCRPGWQTDLKAKVRVLHGSEYNARDLQNPVES